MELMNLKVNGVSLDCYYENHKDMGIILKAVETPCDTENVLPVIAGLVIDLIKAEILKNINGDKE